MHGMKKITIAAAVLVVAGGIVAFRARNGFPVAPAEISYKNISYEISGQTVTLASGYAETEAAPGSASKVTTSYFGNEAKGDFNADGLEDVAFLVTQSSGGSGTFYYAVAALKTEGGYTGTNAILLGDRIAPQTTEFRNGKIIVNYAARKSGEPMTAAPSVGISTYLTVANGTLVAIEK